MIVDMKTKQVSISLTPSELKRLNKYVKATGATRSEWVRNVLLAATSVCPTCKQVSK